ncbi:hypothetical protein J6TS1_18340 [Siminovitchia terrae]|uniref:Uncharacterized protein n=1 Tax=Siminovitchia terrae TaxID=1914933 RepID=A0ABQ4KWD1_SIMTE|nr:hypothetical protein J6TS1_18340 [Siminovitchia terrae]
MNSNSILKERYNRDLFRELEHCYVEGKGNDESIRSLYTGLFKKWKAGGEIRNDIDDELLSAFCDSLGSIDTHMGDIGIPYFPQVIRYL